ncbi:MAG: nucleotide exchange factor GrpE [Clostridia bacterium]
MTKKKDELRKEDECKCGCTRESDGESTCTCQNSNGDGLHKCKCNGDESEASKEGEYLSLLKLVQADFDNYRKRTVEEKLLAKTNGISEAVEKFLPAIDCMKKAMTMIKDPKTIEGLEMILKELNNSLTSLGVENIDIKGKQFDPNDANVIATLCDNSLEDNVVLDVVQAGYKINKKVIRYAQVVVNKKIKE